jgi:hypothetical protein
MRAAQGNSSREIVGKGPLRSNLATSLSLWRFAVRLVGLALIAVLGFSQKLRAANAADKPGPFGNSLCYVCHINLQDELITTVHLAEGITCDKCHGLSTEHMNDEMFMTKPDKLFGRTEVERMCLDCHQSHKDPQAVEAFRAKWLGRARPNGRAVTPESVCTDCHGTHNIVKGAGKSSERKQAGEWINLFNGRDIAGWEMQGKALWTVKAGCLIADARAGSGDLWAEPQLGDYRLSVTFRVRWPLRAGIWLRGSPSVPGPRIEIRDDSEAGFFAGSVSLGGEQPVLANLRENLFEKHGWNTISAEVRHNRFAVWLNGQEIGGFVCEQLASGQVGFHIDNSIAPKDAGLTIREVLVQPLDGSDDATDTAEPDTSGFVPLFNGKDLFGWQAEGGAKWIVQDGAIVGVQGQDNASGDLFTRTIYKEFILVVTYRVEWPCNSGVWFRYQGPDKAYQADILEYKDPECYSGTLYCPGKMFLAMNTEKALVNREGWNRMTVQARGEHIRIWLNGRQVADVRDQTSDSGRVGFQVHAGKEFGQMKIVVREVLLKPL